jgi:hypothetical protein
MVMKILHDTYLRAYKHLPGRKKGSMSLLVFSCIAFFALLGLTLVELFLSGSWRIVLRSMIHLLSILLFFSFIGYLPLFLSASSESNFNLACASSLFLLIECGIFCHVYARER